MSTVGPTLLGVLTALAPLVAGARTPIVLAALALLFAVGRLIATFRSGSASGRPRTLSDGGLTLLAGILLLASPSLVEGALVLILSASFVLRGIERLAGGWSVRGRPGWGSLLFDGVFNLALAAAVAAQWPVSGMSMVGLCLGLHMVSTGWSAWHRTADGATSDRAPEVDVGLAQGDAEFARAIEVVRQGEQARRPIDQYWKLTIIATFLAIHVGRMGAPLTPSGMGPPLLATIGDVIAALVLAFVVLVPLRGLWRRLTRPLARRVWRQVRQRSSTQPGAIAGVARAWLTGRARYALQLDQAYASPARALAFGLQLGLPLTAILVATNPIWGFSWYFNTENWPTGLWERWVELRVDDWRREMTRAVSAHGGGGTPASLVAVRPDDLGSTGDFSFLVIGDPGEGDASQHALRDRYLEVGRQPEVKFLVVSSDVIYPAGEMKDYESNFYLPFKGFSKPVYAVPGNHDWYDALEAFNANFLEPDAARAALRGRISADSGLSTTTEGRIASIVDQAARLRREYGVRAGLQRASYFEIPHEGFTLLAVDTGVLRTLDADQDTWLRSALDRARGTFAFVILGHPLYAAGQYQGADDPEFAAIHQLLREHEVDVVMAGDTHDFEHYREPYGADGTRREMLHFVNGGGGAYLSIGTALDWPDVPATQDAAFYPRTDALTAKLERDTTWWQRPLWLWVKRFRAWPSNPEFLSGAFNFNRAPFFQSFVEIRVEPSANRVLIMPHGVRGRLTWRELQRMGAVMPAQSAEDDAVEFVAPMRSPSQQLHPDSQ